MDYYLQLASRAFWDAWDLVFNRSVASCMVGIAIFLSSLFYLRSRKRHRDVVKQLKEVGIAALFTGSAFIPLSLLNFLILTLKTLVQENQSEKDKAEIPRKTAEAALRSGTST